MSLKQETNGNNRVTYDEFNERCRVEEWKCKCGDWIDEDEVIWAKPNGELNTDVGDPYCEVCLPEE